MLSVPSGFVVPIPTRFNHPAGLIEGDAKILEFPMVVREVNLGMKFVVPLPVIPGRSWFCPHDKDKKLAQKTTKVGMLMRFITPSCES
jgi:hypothetical protein